MMINGSLGGIVDLNAAGYIYNEIDEEKKRGGTNSSTTVHASACRRRYMKNFQLEPDVHISNMNTSEMKKKKKICPQDISVAERECSDASVYYFGTPLLIFPICPHVVG